MSEPGYVLAVDGGQSSTLALLAAYDGRILGVGHGGPANHIHEPGGMDRLRNALGTSIEGALRTADVPSEQITHAHLGMTGSAEMARTIASDLLPATRVQSTFDFVTALAGASIAQPGVVVIAGTGAVAYGRLDDGREAKAGGWGYVMGDEGSGYDLGIQALRAATQAEDGRGTRTQLQARVPAHFGLPSLDAVRDAVYEHRIGRPQIASLAAVVTAAAVDGDALAQVLLHEAGEALGAAAVAVIERLQQRGSGMAVYTTGGVFQAGKHLLAPFETTIRRASRASIVRSAAFSPAVGALFMALKAAGIPVDDPVLMTIRATLPRRAIAKHETEA